MLHLFRTGIIPLWLYTVGILAEPHPPRASLLDLLQLNPPPPGIMQLWQSSLTRYAQQGFSAQAQGMWLQTQDQLWVSHNALNPLPAASLTKTATTLAVLKTWGPDHTFVTEVRATGPVVNGVLQGDLVMVGGGDPLFVGPEALSVGHSLNQMGVLQVSGDLIIVGAFSMDFLTDPIQAGERLRQGFQGQIYPSAEENRYTTPPARNISSALDIQGSVRWTAVPPQSQLLLRHSSLPLYALLKQMNVNSNNALAESFTAMLGGVANIMAPVTASTGVSVKEINLLNGSGLGQENRLSPRAVVAILQGIQRELTTHQMTLADVFPVAKHDRGTIEDRPLPTAAIVKTGTLWNVSALAGVIQTQKRGPVWFTLINRGENIDGFRQTQDRLLQQLTQALGAAPVAIPALRPSRVMPTLGDPQRNHLRPQSS
ncbi:D-alanyl-D-alanine carboxypeptidase [Acaryochloris sp. IP29b_bin.137]|uniref:D-alanyl-D-alanine carboxypeptidase n=1 Tax=Acaryochloris sp. IP29b_bin.137 TaxID=2969217 RepID=UPI002617AB71|nr:D-alanyl-D-alanine carboxypeptidase [Acaryochloris sp. IP29b_bin.137]